MIFDAGQTEFRRLSSTFRHESDSIIPFVGAGLSIYGSPENRLPLWGQLVGKLVNVGVTRGLLDAIATEKVEYLLHQGHYISATDLLLNHLGQATFGHEISASLSITDRQVPPAILKLIEISWSLIITTNLDRFIEQAWFEHHAYPIHVITHINRTELMRKASGLRDNEKPTLAKLHGSVEFPESWVLDSNAYRSLTGDQLSSYSEALRNILLRNVFFVGYGMSDMDFDILLDQISTIFPYGVGTAFTLLSTEYQSRTRMHEVFRNSGVRPIWYDVVPSRAHQPDAGHGAVLECIDMLVASWRKGQGNVHSEWLGFPKFDVGFEGRVRERADFTRRTKSTDCLGVQIIGSAGTGKTAFIRQVLSEDIEDVIDIAVEGIFAISFNRYDPTAFVNHLYHFLADTDRTMPKIGIDEQIMVRRICQKISQRTFIIVMDGMEELLDHTGQIRAPAVSRIVLAISASNSFLVCTSRQKISLNFLSEMILGPFERKDIDLISDNFNSYSSPKSEIAESFIRHIDSHALDVKLTKALTDEQIKIVAAHASKGKVNGGARLTEKLLETLLKTLSPSEKSFLVCLSMSKRPITIMQAFGTFCFDHKAPEINGELIGVDLRQPLQSLIKKSLVQIEGRNRIGLHPLIHQRLNKKTLSKNSKNFHQAIATYLANETGCRAPSSFDECEVYFDLCYHLSLAKEWKVFHKIYYRLLNREHKNYLGNVLGSWEYYKKIAEFCFKSTDPEGRPYPSINPSYYLSCVARAYKHLGEPTLSSTFYRRCLVAAIAERSTECARYANNFFSLSTLLGNTNYAINILKLNFATLHWIRKKWRRCWQEEYALNSAGYFYGLLGHTSISLKYFEKAERVWVREKIKKPPLFDYYRVYKIEILLTTTNPNFFELETIARTSIENGVDNGWLETEVSGLCAFSSINRERAARNRDMSALLYAKKTLRIALDKSKATPLPRMRLLVLLEAIRLEITGCRMRLKKYHAAHLKALIKEAEHIVSKSKFILYKPEVHAAEGWALFLSGNPNLAKIKLYSAKRNCLSIGTLIFCRSNHYLTSSLAEALNVNLNIGQSVSVLPTPYIQLEKNYDYTQLSKLI